MLICLCRCGRCLDAAELDRDRFLTEGISSCDPTGRRWSDFAGLWIVGLCGAAGLDGALTDVGAGPGMGGSADNDDRPATAGSGAAFFLPLQHEEAAGSSDSVLIVSGDTKGQSAGKRSGSARGVSTPHMQPPP